MVFGKACRVAPTGTKLPPVRDSILPQNRENMCLVEIEETILVFIGVPTFRSHECVRNPTEEAGCCVVPEH